MVLISTQGHNLGLALGPLLGSGLDQALVLVIMSNIRYVVRICDTKTPTRKKDRVYGKAAYKKSNIIGHCQLFA